MGDVSRRGRARWRPEAAWDAWSEVGDRTRIATAAAVIGAVSLALWGLGVPSTVAVGAFAALAAATAVYCYVRLGRDLFHPMVFPMLYVSFALLAPWAYARMTGRAVGYITTDSLQSAATWVMVLTALGWYLGTLLVLRRPTEPGTSRMRRRGPQESAALVRLGRTALWGVLLATVLQVFLTRGTPYGYAQTAYGLVPALSTARDGFFVVAVALLVLGNLGLRRRPLALSDWAVVGAVAACALVLLHSRSVIIAPALVIAWGYTRHHLVRPRTIAGLAAVAVLAFVAVGNARSPDDPFLQGDPVARTLVDTSTPFAITHQLTELVPISHPFELGQTYVASLQMMLPGPITRAIMPGTPETATFVFRELTNQTNPNSGVGFSLPSESYLNFGTVGAFVIALLVGSVYGWTYRRSAASRERRTFGVAYAVLLGALPYGIRSDSLGQLKMTVYPIVIVALVAMGARWFLDADRGSRRRRYLGILYNYRVDQTVRLLEAIDGQGTRLSSGRGTTVDRGTLRETFAARDLEVVSLARLAAPENRPLRVIARLMRVRLYPRDIVAVETAGSLSRMVWVRARISGARVVCLVLPPATASTSAGTRGSMGALLLTAVRTSMMRTAAHVIHPSGGDVHGAHRTDWVHPVLRLADDAGD